MIPTNEYVEIHNGGYYEAGTRIGIDAGTYHFGRGRSASAIFQAYPSIGSLAQLYSARFCRQLGVVEEVGFQPGYSASLVLCRSLCSSFQFSFVSLTMGNLENSPYEGPGVSHSVMRGYACAVVGIALATGRDGFAR